MKAKLTNKMNNKVTIGQKYGPAMSLKSQAQADAYFEECVQHTMAHGKSREEAEQIERDNLAYYAGYYGDETRERVERLFHCKHPVFGSIAENGPPSIGRAFKAGLKLGQDRR